MRETLELWILVLVSHKKENQSKIMNCTDSVNFTIPSENSDVADKEKWGKGGVSLLFKVNHLFEC